MFEKPNFLLAGMHYCGAMGCRLTCVGEVVFCQAHWVSLKPVHRHRLMNTYQSRQNTGQGPPASLSHLLALRLAINSLAVAEGRMTPDQAAASEERTRDVLRQRQETSRRNP